MRITIENFGAIKHFKFDTEKDMYLIFGKNSVGKSYGISLVYLILKLFKQRANLGFAMELQAFFDNQAFEHQDNADFNNRFAQYVKGSLIKFLNNSFITDLNRSLINSFNPIDALQNQLSNEELRISLEFIQFGAVFELKKTMQSDGSIMLQIIDAAFKQPFDKLINKLDKDGISSDYGIGLNFVMGDFYSKLSTIRGVYYLPASRSGLYQGLGAFAQIIVELSKSRNIISKPIHLPTISEPVADYFLRLSEADSSNQSGLSSYTDAIEHDIMSGNVEFDDDTKRLIFKPKDTQLKLDLSSTSSMVSELAPIVAYLKHILPNADTAKPAQKPLIFIEEPEAHLHPETQVKLMDVLARLVKDNKIKLVMTSHSNYIFNKASNLVMDGKIDPDKFKAVLFRMTETGSVAENMATDAYGIDDDNFIDTAESLYEEKLAIINKLNG